MYYLVVLKMYIFVTYIAHFLIGTHIDQKIEIA